MNLPLLFVVLPVLLSIALLVLPKRPRLAIFVSLTIYLMLFLVALLHNFGEVMRLGPISLEMGTSLDLLGRSLILDNQDRLFLLIVSFLSMVWIGGIRASGLGSRVIPYQLLVSASLTAALGVEPFIYSAVFVEIAVLSSLPMVIMDGKEIGKGVLRFLIFQTLAMPLILLGGWVVSGNQASPSDIQQMTAAGFFLGTGFAFWLAVFPFHSWIPQLCEDSHPFLAAFLLTVFPQIALMALLRFTSEVAWIRGSQVFGNVLLTLGLIMILASAIWAIYERKVLRIFGLVVLFETGFLLLLISVRSQMAVETLFLSLIPRGLALILAGFSISVLFSRNEGNQTGTMNGRFADHPFASAGVLISFLSIIGFPLLAEFPSKLVLLELLSNANPGIMALLAFGFIGMIIPVLSLFQKMVRTDLSEIKVSENWLQILLISVGGFLLVVMGLFPNLLRLVLLPLLQYLPKII